MGAGGDAPEEVVQRPRTDRLEYGAAVLPNRLQVLVISDKETDKASAAMDVNVGSLSDPPELPGLAHFLEHMLFYASEAYPTEDAYSRFISEHGGSTNAFTAAEDTCYHFDVNSAHLEPALDRFAGFFTCALISADGVEREANAVDSEHGKNLNSDAWRFSQLLRATANQRHPFSRFHTGSLDTLLTGPRAKGLDVRQALCDFAAQRYSANTMRLVLYGRESVPELLALAEAKFGGVADRGLPPSAFPGNALLPEQLGALIRVVPQKDTDSLRLQWPIPPQQGLFRSQPCGYVSHLLGHEGEGSVFAVLKARGWATQLSAGEGGASFSGRSFLEVRVLLTKEGQRQVPQVCGLVFEYLRLLTGPSGVTRERWEEARALARLEFEFSDRMRPGRLTPLLAQTLQHAPPQLALLALHRVPLDYEPEAIRAVLAELTPANVRILWASKEFQGQTDRREQWYGTEHSVGRIPPEWLAAWAEGAPGSGLHLPKPNPYIPTDLAMLPAADGAGPAPRVVHTSGLLTLWHKQEVSFGAPKAVAYFSLQSPEAYASPEAAVLTRLLARLVGDRLSETSYEAELAGLSYAVHNTATGLLVSFAGFNDKLPVLAETVFDTVVGFQADAERFEVQKEAVAREYRNLLIGQQPYQTATYTSSVAFELRRWHVTEYQAVIGDLTLADLSAWLPRLFRRVAVTAFVSGNMRQADAVALAGRLEQLLKRPEARVVRLAPGRPALLQLPTPNPENDNSAIMLEYQVGPDDLKANVTAELLVQCVKQEAFHVLRTQQQLGYIVFFSTWSHQWAVRSLAFILQSTVHAAATLEARCEGFLTHAAGLLAALPEEEFAQRVAELAKDKLEAPLRLAEQAAREWREIDAGTLQLQPARPQAEVDALRLLTKRDLLAFFEKHLLDPDRRRKLSIHIRSQRPVPDSQELPQAANGHSVAAADGAAAEDGPAADGAAKEAEGGGPAVELISDLWEFKRRQEAYASLK